jgi:putative membrane protein
MEVRTRRYDVAHRRRRPTGVRAALPWLLAMATIGLQIAYQGVDGEAKRKVTIAIVVVFFLASVTHAAVHRGMRWAAVLVVVTAGGGLAAEAVGVRTGFPFGDYSYTGSLGPTVLDVPVIVPLAWTMMAYPLLLAARRISRRLAAPIGAFGLAAWDVFLDPQMVDDGRWRWADPTPGLRGVEGVPLTNFAGWLLVGLVMMAILHAVLPRARASEAQPATLLLWTWLGSIVGNVFWFGSPDVALAGGIAMGLVTVPYVWALWQSRP